MADNILRIEAKKYKEETVVVSARIPKDMLQDIDMVAKESGRTRNEVITMFIDYALKNTEIVERD
jgi:metal-responsive CopG/Arc/MetJ family transcriptional regulator